MDPNKDSLDKLLKNIPIVYNKTKGTVIPPPVGFPNLDHALSGASNVVNLMDSVGNTMDSLLDAIDTAQQESLIGITPVNITDPNVIANNVDEVALPGYVFNIAIPNSSNANVLGFPKNLSKPFYITINNTGADISVPFSVAYGNFQDGVLGNYNPTAITTDGSYLYIVDRPANVVLKSTLSGQFVASWGTWNSFTQVINNGIPVTINGAPVLTPTTGGAAINNLNSPGGITTDGTYLYIVDSGSNRIVQTLNDGTFVAQWGSLGTGNTNLNNPTGIITDGTNLFVTDTNNNRVIKLAMPLPAPATPFIAQWGILGTGNTNLKNPTGITTDGTYLYICDTGNNRIVQLVKALPGGPYAGYWGSSGSGTTNLASPLGVSTDNTFLYIDDTGNNRVVKVALPLVPANPYTLSFVVPGSLPGSTVNILFANNYPYNNITQPVLLNCDTAAGVVLTDLFGNELGNFQFIVSTAKLIIIPSGSSVILQYTPSPTNPFTIPGTYDLIHSSMLPQLTPNYNAVNTSNGIGADSDSFTYPQVPDCLDSIGISFGVKRFGNKSTPQGENDHDYKNRIKIQAFGNKITLVGMLYQLKQSFSQDTSLKVYEGFTQAGVNTGFTDTRKNTSAIDLHNFILAYPGYPTSVIVYQMDSNTGLITSIAVAPFVASLTGYNPFNIYITFNSKNYVDRGVYSGGNNTSSSPFTPVDPIGSFDDLYSEFVLAGNPSGGFDKTTKFGSRQSNPDPRYGGFIDTQLYVNTAETQKLAFMVNATKAAGITAFFIQLL